MKIILAPNAFKGSMSAMQAALAMEQGVRAAFPRAEVVAVPVADGGDGLASVLIDALGGEARVVTVRGPLGEPVQATLCLVPTMGLAAVEMAEASGLALLAPQERDPTCTTTYGTGDLIRAALDLGARRIVIGIGGSATNDGGIGMAAALGVRFLDAAGVTVAPVGGALGQIRRIDLGGLDPRLAGLRCEAICDVDNPLLGPHGAAQVYGPQKGGTPAQADLVITGEGQIDFQTAFGKAPAGVAERAKARGIPCVAIAGGIGERRSDLYPLGIDAFFSLCSGPMSLEQAIQGGPVLLAAATEQVVRCFFRGRR
jgi:glycerate kinase